MTCDTSSTSIPRGREDQHPDLPPLTDVLRSREHFLKAMQNRQRECGGLPGPGLGRAEQVATLHDVRDRFRLNRRHFFVTGLFNGLENDVRESQ